MHVGRFLRWIYHNLPEPPSTNFVLPLTSSPYELLPANPIIYDISAPSMRALDIFGTPPLGATIICTDIRPGPGVDVVADAQNMPQIPSDSAESDGGADRNP